MTAASAQRSLTRVLSIRLVTAAVLAIVLQIGITAVRSYLDEIDLATNYVRYESKLLLSLVNPSGTAVSDEGALPSRYRDVHRTAYAFRIIGPSGQVIAQRNGSLLAALSPWRFPQSETQDYWLRRLEAERWMHIAGGIHLSRDDKDIWVEVATLGDPAGAHWSIFARELLADVWMPMIPLVVLTLGVAILTVRHSLEPLVRAADQRFVAVLQRGNRLDVTRMPREAASLGTAINGLLDKVTELLAAQRAFLARAAHELRTPLSIMLLELGHIEDARARRLEGDVKSMSETVDRLLTLSRLEARERPEPTRIDLVEMAGELIRRVKTWSDESRHTLELVSGGPVLVDVDPFAIREALRNLIDNAVRHSPPGSRVRIVVGPGKRVAVEDSGPGIDLATSRALLEPFARGTTEAEGSGLGLAIVAEAAALHHAALDIGRSGLGGARVELRFPETDQM